MFCLSMNPNHHKAIQELNYIPVGLGRENFSNNWYRDNTGQNISEKNKFYGEYTFHYWLWKNYIDRIEDGWIGFCQYRKFWSLDAKNIIPNNFEELKKIIINEIPDSYENFETILGDHYPINQFKLMKFLKGGLKMIIKQPSYLYDKNKRNIKFHFDLMHGYKNLDKAIKLLDDENRTDFNEFVNSEISFNPHNMFICKSKKILKKYYSTIFPWLKLCEKEFGFDKLSGYGQIRIYGFLAERFMSYWFQKNTKCKTIPIVFYDISKK